MPGAADALGCARLRHPTNASNRNGNYVFTSLTESGTGELTQHTASYQKPSDARPPDLDPLDIGLLAASGLSLVRGAADLGEGLLGLARGLLESGSREAEPLGLRGAGALEGKALPALTRLEPKIQRQMVSRGRTRQDILEVVEKGVQSPAVDRTAGFTPATQYLDPPTGRFIVVNDASGDVIQISGPGFRPNPPVR